MLKQDIIYIWGEGSGPLHPIGPRNHLLVTVTLNPKRHVGLKTAGGSWQAL